MPPKKPPPAPKTAKIVADKTFGLKNKNKSAKVQKHIQQLHTQAASGGTPEEKRKIAEKAQREAEKAAAAKAQAEVASLLKPSVQQQKVPFGVDPKSVVCNFWRQGTCEKGKRCKFAHDLAVERKVDKRSLYDNGEGTSAEGADAATVDKKADTMDTWDEEKLRSVVLSKAGNPKTTTDKVCKFFIDAVENGKYGWFWTCPGGGAECKYKHVLPPGFVLKTAAQRAAEKAALDKSPLKTLTLEDFLETERHKLTGTLTPVTEESFRKWKSERLSKKAAEEEARRKHQETGRELFEKGGWQESEGEESDEEFEGKGKGRADADLWDLEEMRRETERMEEEAENERVGRGDVFG